MTGTVLSIVRMNSGVTSGCSCAASSAVSCWARLVPLSLTMRSTLGPDDLIIQARYIDVTSKAGMLASQFC